MNSRLRTLLALVGAGGVAVGHFSVRDKDVPSVSAVDAERVDIATEFSDPALRQLFSAIDSADGDTAAMARLFDSAATDLERRVVISRWVQLNPQSALDALGERSYIVFYEWARIDPYAAIAAARADTSKGSGQFAIAVLDALAATHPPAFFDAIVALNKVPPWGAMWDQAFGRLFEEDPSKAIEAFQQLSETNQAACTRNFARQWAEVDPKAALKWAEENGNREVVHSVIETTARKDPLAALRSVKSWNSDELRDAVSAGFSDWSSSQLIEAMQQLKSEGNDDWHVWKSAQERLLQEHRGRPDAACAQIGSIQDDELRERMSLEYAKNCPLTDIAAVLPWLEQQFLSERELKEIGSNLGAKLFDPILKDHPDPRELVSLLSSGPLRDSLQRAIDAEQAVRSGDYATFAAWYETISGLLELSGQVRDIVQSHIDRLREQSPSEAAKFAASLGGDTSTSRLGATLFDWFQRDPETASNWVANSSKDVSVQAVRQSAAAVADFWTRADPVAAAAWATSLNGEAHEVAIDRVASIWTWQNPSEAVAWASAFEDVDLRARASGIVARNWLEADPYGATEWLATLEHGEVRDQTIAGMMPEAGRYFDDTLNLAERTAIQWLADVDDRTLRRDTLSRLFRWEAWVDEGGGPKKLAAILTSAGVLEDDVRAIRAAAEQRQAEPNPESDSDDDDPFSSQ